MDNITNVRIRFEDGQTADLAPAEIKGFHLTNLRTDIGTDSLGCIRLVRSCDSAVLEVSSYADGCREGLRVGNTLFDQIRINQNIVGFTVTYNGKEEETIYTPWENDGDDEYTNKLQHCRETDDGMGLINSKGIVVVICTEEKLKEFKKD